MRRWAASIRFYSCRRYRKTFHQNAALHLIIQSHRASQGKKKKLHKTKRFQNYTKSLSPTWFSRWAQGTTPINKISMRIKSLSVQKVGLWLATIDDEHANDDGQFVFILVTSIWSPCSPFSHSSAWKTTIFELLPAAEATEQCLGIHLTDSSDVECAQSSMVCKDNKSFAGFGFH